MPGRDAIPTPPRRVRWAAALRHRWTLGLIGGLLALPSIFLAITFTALGVDVLPIRDDLLDAESSFTNGRVTDVHERALRSSGSNFDRLSFEFWLADGSRVVGWSFAPATAGLAAGADCPVEYSIADPTVARIRGTRFNPVGGLWSAILGWSGLPGIALCLFWIRGATRLRLMMSTGRLAIARVLERRPVFGVNPPQLNVSFEFDDQRGNPVRTRHWVAARSPLGRELESGTEHPQVLFDEGSPDHARLVHRSDFTS